MSRRQETASRRSAAEKALGRWRTFVQMDTTDLATIKDEQAAAANYRELQLLVQQHAALPQPEEEDRKNHGLLLQALSWPERRNGSLQAACDFTAEAAYLFTSLVCSAANHMLHIQNLAQVTQNWASHVDESGDTRTAVQLWQHTKLLHLASGSHCKKLAGKAQARLDKIQSGTLLPSLSHAHNALVTVQLPHPLPAQPLLAHHAAMLPHHAAMLPHHAGMPQALAPQALPAPMPPVNLNQAPAPVPVLPPPPGPVPDQAPAPVPMLAPPPVPAPPEAAPPVPAPPDPPPSMISLPAPPQPRAAPAEADSPLDEAIMKWLQDRRLTRWAQQLHDLGVEEMADLSDVTAADLKQMGMKELQVRRFLAGDRDDA